MGSFNVRVYGLLIRDGSVLTVEEPVKDSVILKFPGGGLEFGEGLIDGLKREFKEELNCRLSEVRHFYTTEFFVESMFNPEHQIISIYYLVNTRAHTIQLDLHADLHFKWMPLTELHEDMFALPIDKVVVKMLHADGDGSLEQYHYFPL